MNLPSLPFDNFYKFFALAGVALFISCIYNFTQASMDAVKLYSEAVLRRMEDKSEVNLSEYHRKSLASMFERHSRILESDHSLLTDSAKVLLRTGEYRNTMKKLTDSLYYATHRAFKAQMRMETGKTELQNIITYINAFIWLHVVGILAGSAFMWVGFKAWSDKVQHYQDIILKRDGLAAEKELAELIKWKEEQSEGQPANESGTKPGSTNENSKTG